MLVSGRSIRFLLSAAVLLTAQMASGQEREIRVNIQKGAWLGLYLGDAGKDEWEGGEGALVKEVIKESPADKAGVREGDIILKLQDRTVRDASDVTRDISRMKAGDEVTLLILRDGARITCKARLEERKVRKQASDTNNLPEGLEPAMPWSLWSGLSGRRMGLRVQEMDADLAEYFQMKKGEGVLVTEVEPESPAARAGLKSGDVIIRINGEAVADPGDLQKAIQQGTADDHEVVYMRKGVTTKAVVRMEQPERMRMRFYEGNWPFDRQTMQELREELDLLKDELRDLKIKLKIEIEEK